MISIPGSSNILYSTSFTVLASDTASTYLFLRYSLYLFAISSTHSSPACSILSTTIFWNLAKIRSSFGRRILDASTTNISSSGSSVEKRLKQNTNGALTLLPSIRDVCIQLMTSRRRFWTDLLFGSYTRKMTGVSCKAHTLSRIFSILSESRLTVSTPFSIVVR